MKSVIFTFPFSQSSIKFSPPLPIEVEGAIFLAKSRGVSFIPKLSSNKWKLYAKQTGETLAINLLFVTDLMI